MNNKIMNLDVEQRFKSYLEDKRRLTRFVEVKRALNEIVNSDPRYHSNIWTSIMNNKYKDIIDIHEEYMEQLCGQKTKMEKLKTVIPYQIESLNESDIDNITKGCNEISDIDSLSKGQNSSIHFQLETVSSVWDPYYTLELYKEGKLGINDIRQFFYFNAAISKIQTVNYINGRRVIVNIEGYLDIINELDVYHNAYLSHDAPKIRHKDTKVLIIESNNSSAIDRIIKYIKDNGIVTITSIKDYYKTLIPIYGLGVSTIVKDLNENCIDITYTNKNIPSELNIGDILRCSLKGESNSLIVAYCEFNGSISHNIRVGRSLQHYY